MSERNVRIAVLGAALFTETGHVPGIRSHPRGEVAAIYSRDLDRAREMAARCSVPEATDDLDALLVRDDIDAVTIASSNDKHHPYTMAALRAGKHVLCEKPMALTTAEAAEMTREARRAALVSQVGFTFRYTYGFQELRRRVIAGDIGAPYFVEINGQWFQRIQPEAPGTWRDSLSLHGSGHLGEMGSHFIDTVNFLCGPDAGFISEVVARTHVVPRTVVGPDGKPAAVDTPDIASFLLSTERALDGAVLVSRASPPPTAYGIMHRSESRGHMGYVTVTGERGALCGTFTRGEGEVLRRMEPGSRWEQISLPEGARDNEPHGVWRMMAQFVDNVLRGNIEDTDASFEDGYRAQAATDAVLASAASRRWEPVATRLQ